MTRKYFQIQDAVFTSPAVEDMTFIPTLLSQPCKAICGTKYPGYQRLSLACGGKLRRPQADTSSAECRSLERRSFPRGSLGSLSKDDDEDDDNFKKQ